VYGHCDQPPRVNFSSEAIEAQASALPNQDWNERLTWSLRSSFRLERHGDLTGKVLRDELTRLSERLRILGP